MSYLPTAIAESVAISIEETKYKDFYFDEESGQFTGQVVEGVQALKGWIYFALRIARYSYPRSKFLLTFYRFMLSYNQGLGENSLDHSKRGEFLAIFVKKRDTNERIKCFY